MNMNNQIFIDVSEIPNLEQPKHCDYFFELNRKKVFNDNLGFFREFWENLDNFGCKEYHFFATTFIRGRCITLRLRKFKIKCVGGEYMSKEKAKMVFVDEIPEQHRGGRSGYNFEGLLSQIPEGKAWKIGEKDKPSIATVREYVKKHAEGYDAVQRTIDGKRYLFVSKIPEDTA